MDKITVKLAPFNPQNVTINETTSSTLRSTDSEDDVVLDRFKMQGSQANMTLSQHEINMLRLIGIQAIEGQKLLL
jgi:hypothetical protein